MQFRIFPIGWIRKTKTKTRIVLDKKYQTGLLGLRKLSEIWVIWWFDRNDTPRLRSTLQVHPKGNPANPLTGVFATRAPMRPNLIALSRCKILSIKKNVIEIDSIDAFTDTPVLDLKP
jgi:tRNA-Thr(GGU) m(6)t(6)A37 methyltransferase TsaA